MRNTITIVCLAATLVPAAGAAAQARNQYGNPMKLAARPTTAAINEADLRTRLYIFADDSMLGRQSGTVGNQKGTDYIAAELKRLGIEPAGDNGTYFQALRYGLRYVSPDSRIVAGGQTLAWGRELVGTASANASLSGVQVIYGGGAGGPARQIAPALAGGRSVLLGDEAVLATTPTGRRLEPEPL
jgi:hypothetical protein